MLGPRLGGAAAFVLVACAACSETAAPPAQITADAPARPAAGEPTADPTPRDVPEETLRQLEALGYVETRPTANPETRGVTARTGDARGFNVYSSRDRASAVIADMDGTIVHRWRASEEERTKRTWMHVEPLPTGELFVITRDRDLTKYDFDSNIVWRRRLRAHHDLAVHEDGRLFVLVRSTREHPFRGGEVPILADAIAVLSPEGEPLETIDLLPLLHESISTHRLSRVQAALAEGTPAARLVRPGGVGDVLHTNSIEFLDRDIPGVAPAGSVLLSFRATSRVMILSAALDEVLWTYGAGELEQQHNATQLANGNLLIFDNGIRRRQSRVIELDAATKEIVWEYTDEELFSRIRGGAQRLPNGNVLITESEDGHALEVTRGGEIVWEYWNPDVRRGGGGSQRAVFYRLNRFPESYFDPRLGL